MISRIFMYVKRRVMVLRRFRVQRYGKKWKYKNVGTKNLLSPYFGYT